MHKLSIKATFTSGTGSLAEMAGLEGYGGDLSWNLRVISNPENNFNLGYRLNKDGFVEVFWTNTIPESMIEKYVIHSGLTQSKDIIINDPKQKYFVDSGYVCGYVYYQASTYLKDGTVFWKQFSFEKPTPTLSFENIGVNRLRIYWNKPFANGRYKLSGGNTVYASDITDTTFTTAQIFGPSRQFNLEIKPKYSQFDNTSNKFSAWNWYSQGSALGLPNWPLFAYNKKDNILYSSQYNDLVAFDATTMNQINNVSINGKTWGFMYGGKIATAPHNSSVAAMTGEETWIYKDSHFDNSIKIPSLPGDVNTKLAAITSDDRFFVVLNGSNVCSVFNSTTGAKIFEIPFTYKTIYSFPELTTVSEDGKYFCASSENGMEIFQINGTTANVIYTDTRFYKGAIFIPSQPNTILFRVGSVIEVRQLPDFSIMQSFDVSKYGALLCNIDPASLNLLYFQNDSLKVCKVNNLSETLFQIKSDEQTCKMYNNKLLTFGRGATYLDISPYLNKNYLNLKPKIKNKQEFQIPALQDLHSRSRILKKFKIANL
ncbi:MAG: hypothetical protein ACOYOT_08155 [Bacteroidales bacterium]